MKIQWRFNEPNKWQATINIWTTLRSFSSTMQMQPVHIKHSSIHMQCLPLAVLPINNSFFPCSLPLSSPCAVGLYQFVSGAGSCFSTCTVFWNSVLSCQLAFASFVPFFLLYLRESFCSRSREVKGWEVAVASPCPLCGVFHQSMHTHAYRCFNFLFCVWVGMDRDGNGAGWGWVSLSHSHSHTKSPYPNPTGIKLFSHPHRVTGIISYPYPYRVLTTSILIFIKETKLR